MKRFVRLLITFNVAIHGITIGLLVLAYFLLDSKRSERSGR